MIDNGREMIAKQAVIALPAQIPQTPGFFIAEPSDKTIQAFGGFSEKGKTYKIGTKKTDTK
ncbi:MAG: hypothetical protein QG653_215 [Patescibacteria group bacterium]|nr:hypothetical protein [Patescibacteria group bacterium]